MNEESKVEGEVYNIIALNRAYGMLSSCNKAVIRATDETSLLTEICEIATEMGGYKFAWVGYAMPGPEKKIIPAACVGDDDGYLSKIKLSYDESNTEGQGPGGRAVRSGLAVITSDVREESDTFHWKAEALKRGIRSIACLPLKDGDLCFGILALYSERPNSVTTEECILFQELADNLAFGICVLRDRIQRETTQSAIIKVAQAVSNSSDKQFYNLLTKNMVAALGATGGILGKIRHEEHTIETLSFVIKGIIQDNIHYSLSGTPCEHLSTARYCVYESDVQRAFPNDHLLAQLGIEGYAGVALQIKDEPVGILSVIFDKPIPDPAFVKSLLTIFAERVASEMDRQETDARILRQASLLDKARDAIFTCDLDSGITYWNRSAERLYGYTFAEVSGKPAKELFHIDATAFELALAITQRDGEWMGELSQIDADGKHLTIESRWTLVRDHAGEPVSVLLINTDVTELRELERRFIRAQRLESIGTLAGGIAHDLNNVLTPISMSIELLRDSVRDTRGNELLETIALCSRRGAEMVGQILSFARGVDGKRVIVPSAELIEGLASIIRDTFPKNIRLETSIEAELRPMTGDPTQLQQVLLNLCLNARDAMPDGGLLRVAAENVLIDEKEAAENPGASIGHHIRISVEDTGYGMPAEVSVRIYDPFFTTKEPGKGTGLGLPTALAIVKSHGGFLRVLTEPGKGSRFEVHIPAVAADPRLATQPIEIPQGHGETILIIDDEPNILDITSEILRKYGYEPITAESGKEALQIYSTQHDEIRAVITDMMMPDLDGEATIRRLLLIDPDTRILAVSGVRANGSLAHAAGGRNVIFIAKPFTAATILCALRDLLAEDLAPPTGNGFTRAEAPHPT